MLTQNIKATYMFFGMQKKFLQCIVTGDETWFHHYMSTSKHWFIEHKTWSSSANMKFHVKIHVFQDVTPSTDEVGSNNPKSSQGVQEEWPILEIYNTEG